MNLGKMLVAQLMEFVPWAVGADQLLTHVPGFG